MTESFAEMFEESLAHTEMKPGAIVMGTVVDVRNDGVVVNAGLKSEAVSRAPYSREKGLSVFSSSAPILFPRHISTRLAAHPPLPDDAADFR